MRHIDHAKASNFEKYSAVLPYKEGPLMINRSSGNETNLIAIMVNPNIYTETDLDFVSGCVRGQWRVAHAFSQDLAFLSPSSF